MYEHAKKDFATHGITVTGDISIDVTKMMKNKSKAVSSLTGGIEFLFKKYKVCSTPPPRLFYDAYVYLSLP